MAHLTWDPYTVTTANTYSYAYSSPSAINWDNIQSVITTADDLRSNFRIINDPGGYGRIVSDPYTLESTLCEEPVVKAPDDSFDKDAQSEADFDLFLNGERGEK